MPPEDESGSTGGALDTIPAAEPATLEKVEGEKAPDFSQLGKPRTKEAAAEPAKEAAAAPEAKTGSQTTPKEEKRAGEAPAKRVEAPKEPAKAVKEPEKAVTQPTVAEQPKKEAEKKDLPEEDEIEKMEPRAQAHPREKTSFRELKDLTKKAIREAKANAAAMKALDTELERTRTEAEDLRKSVGRPAPETQAELQRLQLLEQSILAGDAPDFQTEFGAKLTAANEGIFNVLKAQKLPDHHIDDLKAHIRETGDPLSWPMWQEIFKAVDGIPMAKFEIEDAIKNHRSVQVERKAKVDQLQGSKEGFYKDLEERQHSKNLKWAEEAVRISKEVAAPHEWIQPKEIPPNASADVRNAIEDHNSKAGELAKQWQDYMVQSYNRNAKAMIDTTFKAVQVDHLTKELENTKSDLEKANTRIKELEDRQAKVRDAGRASHTESPGESSAHTEPEKIGGDGADAIRGYKWGGRR